MQAKTETQPYEYFDPIFDGTCEAPVDTAYDLPDYCADIQKLLKCLVTPQVSSYTIAGDSLTCQGVCDIRVLYLDAKGDRVRCCAFTQEFTATAKLKGPGEQAVASLSARVEHLTCRAVSARRIDLHAAVAVSALVLVQKQEQLTCGLEGEGIEKRARTLQSHQAVNGVSHQFTIEDQLPLKNGKPPIETILRQEVCCRVTETRLEQGRVTVSGVAEVRFLYLSALDGAAVEKMSASIDFTQAIDCPGAEEGCLCSLRAVAGESSIQPREDDMGEHTSVGVTVRVFLMACLYRPCQVTLLDDAYSVREPLELQWQQGAFLQLAGRRTEVLKKKCSLAVQGAEIQKVLDLWCEQDSVQASCGEGKLSCRARYTLCLLYADAQGRPLYQEKAFDHSFSAALEDQQAQRCSAAGRTELWEYRITDRNTVEVSAETTVTAMLYSRASVKYIAGAGASEGAAPYERPSRLLLYYAGAGESLWDIAKSHRALLSDLQAQNDLYEGTVPQARPLIICNR